MRLKPPAFAFGAGHVKITQKLHLDLFMTCARTSLAPPTSRVKRKRARSQTLRHRFRLRGKQFADPIIKAQIKNRCRARRAREGCLIDHHHFIDAMRADHRLARARFLIG